VRAHALVAHGDRGRESDSGVIAIQRTFLTLGSSLPARHAPSAASGHSTSEHPPIAGRLGLASGVESALSAAQMHGFACWAILGNARFGLVAIPDSVTELHLFLDADDDGALAEARSLDQDARPKRTIIPHHPPRPFSDWNDALRALRSI
jgi:putative DNA primase/helicase